MGKIKSNNNPSLSAMDSASSKTSTNIDVGTEKIADPQVKPKRHYTPRRSFTTAYKQRILAAYDACQNVQGRGELLRHEGLYHSRIGAWRSQLNNASGGRKGKQAVRMDHLTRENEQLKKKLAQAEAIIELQKKVSDLLGTGILSPEKSEMN